MEPLSGFKGLGVYRALLEVLFTVRDLRCMPMPYEGIGFRLSFPFLWRCRFTRFKCCLKLVVGLCSRKDDRQLELQTVNPSQDYRRWPCMQPHGSWCGRR